jgi:hypothetical protein
MKGQVVRCKEKSCIGKRDALVKPSIVFFGEGLPDKFFDRLPVSNSPLVFSAPISILWLLVSTYRKVTHIPIELSDLGVLA